MYFVHPPSSPTCDICSKKGQWIDHLLLWQQFICALNEHVVGMVYSFERHRYVWNGTKNSVCVDWLLRFKSTLFCLPGPQNPDERMVIVFVPAFLLFSHTPHRKVFATKFKIFWTVICQLSKEKVPACSKTIYSSKPDAFSKPVKNLPAQVAATPLDDKT